jgi:excisionase family DNA binding protein
MPPLTPPVEFPTGDTAPPVKRFLTKAQVAELFQIELRTLDSWMHKGFLPYLKIGRTVRFTMTDIEAHIQQHRKTGPTGRVINN